MSIGITLITLNKGIYVEFMLNSLPGSWHYASVKLLPELVEEKEIDPKH
jgi:hypothetical protein